MVRSGHEVWGVDRLDLKDFAGSGYLTGDLTDAEVVNEIVADTRPEWIVHLAAQSSVRDSFDRPAETIHDNTVPALNLLNSIRTKSNRPRLLAIGSADEYGTVAVTDLPVSEDAPESPNSPYALSKLIQSQCCRMFASHFGVDVVIARSFNHTGPGQRDTFVLPSFARQVVEVKRGHREPVMLVGNLDARREFLDIDDVCAAYVALLQSGRTGETYNICSGTSHRVGDLLDRLCELAGVEVEVKVDPDLLRPVDMPDMRGDNAKLTNGTTWKPRVRIDETLQSLLDYWQTETVDAKGTN